MPLVFKAPPKCCRCNKSVYANEQIKAEGRLYHSHCFRCFICATSLSLSNFTPDKQGEIYCSKCYSSNFGPEGFRSGGKSSNLKTIHNEDEEKKRVKDEAERKKALDIAIKMDKTLKQKQTPTFPKNNPTRGPTVQQPKPKFIPVPSTLPAAGQGLAEVKTTLPKFCPECGTKVLGIVKFCSHCGYKF